MVSKENWSEFRLKIVQMLFIFQIESFPTFYRYFPETNDTRAVFAMERIGRTLSHLWMEFRPLSSVTAMQIALQLVSTWAQSNSWTKLLDYFESHTIVSDYYWWWWYIVVGRRRMDAWHRTHSQRFTLQQCCCRLSQQIESLFVW